MQEFYVDERVLLEISKDVYTQVRIMEVKSSYGRNRYVVEPIAGTGQMTVENLKKMA